MAYLDMSKQQAIEQLLKAQRNGGWNLSSAFGGAVGANGRPQVQQVDMNKAIELWLKQDDPVAIQQLATTMHITGTLTDGAYDKIMEAIDGED